MTSDIPQATASRIFSTMNERSKNGLTEQEAYETLERMFPGASEYSMRTAFGKWTNSAFERRDVARILKDIWERMDEDDQFFDASIGPTIKMHLGNTAKLTFDDAWAEFEYFLDKHGGKFNYRVEAWNEIKQAFDVAFNPEKAEPTILEQHHQYRKLYNERMEEIERLQRLVEESRVLPLDFEIQEEIEMFLDNWTRTKQSETDLMPDLRPIWPGLSYNDLEFAIETWKKK